MALGGEVHSSLQCIMHVSMYDRSQEQMGKWKVETAVSLMEGTGLADGRYTVHLC